MGDAPLRSKRGKNWTEPDSLKLIDAYQQVQLEKLGKKTASIRYPLTF
jgi:hypothetical protein